MTDQELDAMLKRILVDSIKLDCEAEEKSGALAFQPSIQHQQQIQLMLKDPLGWARKKGKPKWKIIVQKVAVVLLIISLGVGSLMISSPAARAAFIQWFTEWYETHIVYRYLGDNNSGEMPQYEITELPEGFVESERTELPRMTSITYENKTGDTIYFSYGFMAQGGVLGFDKKDAEISDIEVNHMSGQLFEPSDQEDFRTITWIDAEHNIQFEISGAFIYVDILNIAESVSLVITTK